MTLKQAELGALFYSLNVAKDGSPRKFAFSELAKVNAIATKLDSFPEDGKLTKPEYEVEFTSEEKVFITEKVKEMDWTSGDSKAVVSLIEKLA